MNEKLVPTKDYEAFRDAYFRNPGNLRFGQAFCSLFYPDHSCMNGCDLEELYYSTRHATSESIIFRYIDWTN